MFTKSIASSAPFHRANALIGLTITT